ncbi:hypothetical protein H1P_30035 [Hyella patelloides LEGE 07179]|uniref:Uncharacterized protein n=1 Tax=Hyella patelloides LEGE 07179 TaxID=945734 RepID=A0A563VU98_9CYAN|nr:hypothetical protein [Hyella patelloides]VEP14959.1 hypothetical protein H1P_30035 [Hyella patelloides LEGE 07179]
MKQKNPNKWVGLIKVNCESHRVSKDRLFHVSTDSGNLAPITFSCRPYLIKNKADLPITLSWDNSVICS